MSKPIEPQHDYPICTEPDCEGPLQPLLYAEHNIDTPALVGTHMAWWDTVQCFSCGAASKVGPLTLAHAWYGVGAYLQRLHDKRAPIVGNWVIPGEDNACSCPEINRPPIGEHIFSCPLSTEF